jgi:hypothetical protein
MLEEQRIKLKNQSDKEHDVVDTLRLELASVVTEKNRLEVSVICVFCCFLINKLKVNK